MNTRTCIAMAAGLSAVVLLSSLRADPAFDTALVARPDPLPPSAPLLAKAQGNYQALLARGVEAYHIQFDWGFRRVGEYQASLVAFRDEHGHYWAKIGSKMFWLSGRTPSEWVARLFPDKATEVLVVQRRYDPDEIAFLEASLANQPNRPRIAAD